jgi:hypothetical protein
MRKSLGIAAVLVLAAVVVATASASLRRYEVGSKEVHGVGAVGSFSATVKKPYKMILFCEGTNGSRCGANVVCYRGSRKFTWNRTNLGPYTWNLKKRSWKRLDSCHFTASIKSGGPIGRVVVDATVRT